MALTKMIKQVLDKQDSKGDWIFQFMGTNDEFLVIEAIYSMKQNIYDILYT